MTMKDIFFGLMRACTNLVSGIGSAAVEVLRHADISDKEEDHELDPIGNPYRYTAFGDDRDGPDSYLNPYNPHDIHK